MIECCERLRFTGEAHGKAGFGASMGGQQFQCDVSTQGFLPRFVDHAHAADADQFEDFQLRKCRLHRFDSGRFGFW